MALVTVQYPNKREVSAAAKDWTMLPTVIAQHIAGALVEYAEPITPTDTGALSHPTIQHQGGGRVKIIYDARNENGDYYADYVNRGVSWYGKPVKHYTTHGGPGFLEAMSSKTVVQNVVRNVTSDIGSLVGGAIFDSVPYKNADTKQTHYKYVRPKVFSDHKYDKYFNK